MPKKQLEKRKLISLNIIMLKFLLQNTIFPLICASRPHHFGIFKSGTDYKVVIIS